MAAEEAVEEVAEVKEDESVPSGNNIPQEQEIWQERQKHRCQVQSGKICDNKHKQKFCIYSETSDTTTNLQLYKCTSDEELLDTVMELWDMIDN